MIEHAPTLLLVLCVVERCVRIYLMLRSARNSR